MTVQYPQLQGIVPTSTIVPKEDSLFIPYFTRLYENLAIAINNKDNIYYTIPISNTPTNIPGLATFGAFTVCISGQNSTLPTLVAALAKSDAGLAGVVAVLTSQAGTVSWAGITLAITSTATNFQVANSSVTALTGNFNIRIIGTQ